jgi:AcrR family transcriptional regulator
MEIKMGIAERKEREKTGRKSLIMDRAKELILERGAEKVSMMDIAERAELSKATLYLYFHSKEELFREICNASGKQFMAAFRSRLAADQRGLDVLKQFWNAYLDMFSESDDMIIIFSLKHYLAPDYPVLSIMEQSDPLILNEFYGILKNALARGIDEGVFDSEINTVTVSQAILSLFSNVIEDAAKLPKGERDSALIVEELRKLFQIILKGIARQGLSPSLLELAVYPGDAAFKHTARGQR